ncbi:PKD domain-containing protein [Mucilaginibacter sp. SP1R1]|uniref:PKD domain-containing protein n=1 Tax=Mucilaginibacter sp. SP1R1 TaxID=2723091 RepID=UPI00161E1A0B|nr:PKD domain-containing protein [Mucilaginibacter sp. SP1R1]
MDHIDGASGGSGAQQGGSQMYLYITADVNTTVKVEVADGSFSQSYNVVARGILSVAIPASAFLDSQGQFLKGIHITSQKPVAVYAHIFARSVSGATLLLPVNTLGKSYLSINYTQLSNSQTGQGQEGKPSYSTFNIIGTEDNTTVEITPTQPLIDGKPANVPFNITLKKGEVYQGLSVNDLTGTRIRTLSNTAGSCKKVAVFSGSSKIAIGCQTANFTSDNLFQQVYPTSSWGKNYITAPLRGRNYDVFRIILSDPNTTVNLNGSNLTAAQFTGALYYEFNSTQPNIITADKPIQVVQYAVTQGKTINCVDVAHDVGDPEMIYLNPIEQTLDHVTLNSTNNYAIIDNYINVIIKAAAVPTFTLDGAPYTTFTAVPGNPVYAYAQIKVSSGVHHISAADGFNAIAYGFGNAESYGYAAGTNLKNLNEFIALENPATQTTQTNGCTGAPYKLQLTLPFMTNNIKWDFKDGTTFTDANPVVKGTVTRANQTLYIYEYPNSKTFTTGDYSIVATVFNPVADECGSYDDVEFDFNIAPPPVSKPSFSGTCIGEPTLFTDMSETNGVDIKTWLWDFGDGQTAVVQNPSHTYALAGNYNVRLSVGNQNDCSDISAAIPVHIGAKPVADFKFSAPDCPAADITFADQSTQTDGLITKWLWDFGDGTAIVTKTDNTPFIHTYPSVGNYVVNLSVSNANGCTSAATTKTVMVHELPLADFTTPEVCVDDAFAQFTDKSTIADGTATDFTYLWNFGDVHATAANPNTSADKNPKHKYTEARDDYQVTLTVTSKYGCTYTKTQTFAVNGNVPKAQLEVLNPNDLCSNREVFFKNLSTVNSGVITRLEVTYDAVDPASLRVYDHPVYGQQLRYTYPQFTDGTRNYNIHVVAYSGGVCANSEDMLPIVLKAVPLITFAQAPPLCPDNMPVQITPLSVQGPAGSGVFSGTGISAGGLFNPAQAGTGTFDINYIYTSQHSCADTVKQQISVYPSPTVSAGDDMTVLEGVPVTLKATAGGAATYKWSPSTGLDHDDVLNPVASPSENTTYQLIVTSATGCSAMDEVNISVLKTLVIPNAFTPNGDGYNDLWEIKYLTTYPNNTVDIYNRYGEKLYSSIGYNIPWDGKYKGANVPPGTYYYIINPKNGRKVMSGSVTIIR